MEHLVPWLILKNISGIGNLLFYRLVQHFGTPGRVLQASVHSLKQVFGLSTSMAISVAGPHCHDDALKEIEKCYDRGFHMITQHDSRYPALLLQIPDPPPILYSYGNIIGDACHVAVVGSRKATKYGESCAKKLSRELSNNGLSVVSGMACGIDTAAHTGALNGSGATIAVLGSSLDRIYPAVNRKLFHRIAENGAVVSEFSLNTAPRAHHFPLRNRIISGMSLGTVVVEATHRSGSLITAKLAAEQGREVFSVPGSIHAKTSCGTHNLIKQGAKLVENSKDIVEELTPHIAFEDITSESGKKKPSADTTPPSLSKLETKLLDLIGPYPMHIDQIARSCNLKMEELTGILCQLELKGAILQEPGKFFMCNNAFSESTTSDFCAEL